MASPLRKLFGHTAIYGLSSILGRFLNYLLTPLYTSHEVFQPEQYGIITEMYAYVAFLVVLLTYGMETAFFRFFSDQKNDPKSVYSTAFWSLVFSSFSFIIAVSLFQQPIANMLGYPNNTEYISWFGIIVGLDALTAIPLAKLRADNRPLRFAFVNLSFIGINIGLNLFFLAYCLPTYKAGDINWLVQTFYDPETGVGYVFIANLVASIGRFVLMIPDMLKARFGIKPELLKQMMVYAIPLLIAGLAGIVNETLDRAMLKWMLWDKLGEVETMTQLGIYGACYKLSILITLCIQAYRYAAEPFFFNQMDQANAKETYARMLHIFFAFVMFIFLGVTLFIDVFKHFIPNPAFWSGLDVVPILLLANVFLGAYYNQSVWYKLTDNTRFGSYISIIGAVITIGFNLLLIPYIGFRGSAWATLICYFSMTAVSWYYGKKYYPVPYDIPKLLGYFIVALLFFAINWFATETNGAWLWPMRIAMTLFFAAIFYYLEYHRYRNHEPS